MRTKPPKLGCIWLLGLALGVSSVPIANAQVASVQVRGTEICPQFLCPDGAIFGYDLLSNGRRVGVGLVQVDHHAELPNDEVACVDVFGGGFGFLIGRNVVFGEIVDGLICSTDDPDLFDVTLLMVTDSGVWLCFEGTLDHRPLRLRKPRLPIITGDLYVCSPPDVT